MKISNIEIRMCRHNETVMKDSEMRDGKKSDLEFLVITFQTDEGLTSSTFGFAGRGAEMAGEIANSIFKPFFIGRDPLYREQHWHEYRMADRWWNHAPIYSYGPFDINCWLLASIQAGLPLYKYMGAYRDKVPIYGSSLVLDTPEAYAKEALEYKNRGFNAYKLHPPGRYDFDLEAHKKVRERVGNDFKLMSDPVAPYNFEQALRFGRELEKLNYYWYEEPLFDENFHNLRELTRILDIPIIGTEVIAKHPYSVAECISTRVVDMVRADVSWSGGITATLKTAHLAESFGVQCEIHTAIYHPLELVNLHCCAAIKNSEFFEVLVPYEYFNFGLKESIDVKDGYAHLPNKPGLGIDLDWDFIDNTTFKKI
ncbi:MAG: L-talarate/galactarate dehydratase [Alphaproteobacteria bacterium MarineAlpha5_Bin5]|nr:MAG: L-talarate/galactarate dehydratase [Alphaproteobacteria bacterium MarineAlpha5_Bin5]|tara:strand:+ start:9287 stop:10393 length:1107 start_codon:yes stop_codon:yes gene_type:complete